MLLNPSFAQSLEEANACSHKNYTKPGNCLNLSTGGAFYSGNEDFFTQVVGWGFRAKEEEIAHMEDFYRSFDCPVVGIELATLAGPEIFGLLNKRGYSVCEFSNLSVCKLPQKLPDISVPGVEIRVCKPPETEEWAVRVAEGFGAERFAGIFKRYGLSKGVTAFGAFAGSQIIGGGTVASHQNIFDCGMTSTVPAFRGRGVQKALLRARQNFIAEKSPGAVACVLTEPGSISDNNVRKQGFQTLYTRVKLEKTIHS